MREIDLNNWPRRDHFLRHNRLDNPHFGLCANVDISAFYPAVKLRGLSFTVAMAYLLARAANDLPEFRLRIRGDRVIEHELVHPSWTFMTEGDLFSYCTVSFDPDFARFAEKAAAQIAAIAAQPTVEDEPGQDDLLYMSSIPWVTFTAVLHPQHYSPVDSVPRLAWGKFFRAGQRLHMPLSVQAHHALMDGVHLGRYYARVQQILDQPDFLRQGK